MKYLIFIFGILFFLAILIITYYAYINLLKVDVVFYSSIYAALLAAAIFSIIVFFTPLFIVLSGFEKFLLILINILVGYILAISLPAVIDRSLSFYILEKIDQQGGAVKQDRIEDIFTKEYIFEHRLVDVRLTEQLKSGSIVIEEGCVRLTERGLLLVKFSTFFRANWLPKKRLLMDSYTDILIDPLKNSKKNDDYHCSRIK